MKEFIAGTQREIKDNYIMELVSNYNRNQLEDFLKKLETGEVLHFASPTSKTGFSLWNTSPYQPEFSNNYKLIYLFNLKNVVLPYSVHINKNVLNYAGKILGKPYDHNCMVIQDINDIKHLVDGFNLIKINNNEVYDTKFYDYSCFQRWGTQKLNFNMKII